DYYCSSYATNGIFLF
nr:immunoglobulin light chain junction region [Macaca mulatta]